MSQIIQKISLSDYLEQQHDKLDNVTFNTIIGELACLTASIGFTLKGNSEIGAVALAGACAIGMLGEHVKSNIRRETREVLNRKGCQCTGDIV